MQSNWQNIFQWCLTHEGGFVNDPDDPGGATNRGITQAVYDAFRRRDGLPERSVKHITDNEMALIYEQQYWRVVRGDDLPAGVDYAVYDFAVNSGPARAAKFLQRLVGVDEDGVIGQITLNALSRFDPEGVVRELCKARMAYLKRLPHWRKFGKGWTARVMGRIDGVQIGDTGVIDRGVKLARMRDASRVMAPTSVETGQGKGLGPEKVSSTILDAVKRPEVMGPAVTAGAGGLVSAAQGDGPVAYAIAAVMVVAVVSAFVWFMRKKAAT